jgi:hypothetical protein
VEFGAGLRRGSRHEDAPPAMRGSCREATEGASWKTAELAPSGPLGHLPRDAGEDLGASYRPTIAMPAAVYRSPSIAVSGTAAAIRARSSADSVTSTAPMFSSSRAIFVVPGIGAMPSPWARTQASASCAGGDALLDCHVLQHLHQSGVGGHVLGAEARQRIAEVVRTEILRLLDLACEETAPERAVTARNRYAELAAGVEDLAFRLAGPKRIFALQRRNRMDRVGTCGWRRHPLRKGRAHAPCLP